MSGFFSVSRRLIASHLQKGDTSCFESWSLWTYSFCKEPEMYLCGQKSMLAVSVHVKQVTLKYFCRYITLYWVIFHKIRFQWIVWELRRDRDESSRLERKMFCTQNLECNYGGLAQEKRTFLSIWIWSFQPVFLRHVYIRFFAIFETQMELYLDCVKTWTLMKSYI
jgi:hypothetical protein